MYFIVDLANIVYMMICNDLQHFQRTSFFQWGIMPLLDNHPDDVKHKYEVHVYTGLRSNAGTDSRIRMIVAGTESDSGVRRLEDGLRKVSVVGELSAA